MIRNFVFAGALVLLAACDAGCDNDLLQSEVSPARTRKATKYYRDCGPTTQDTSQVTILRRWTPLTGPGNVFASDAQLEDIVVSWESETRLRISYPANAHVGRRATLVDGVTITYRPRE